MKISKCLMTVTGKHKWQTFYYDTKGFFSWKTIKVPMIPRCEYCGIRDDRKVK